MLFTFEKELAGRTSFGLERVLRFATELVDRDAPSLSGMAVHQVGRLPAQESKVDLVPHLVPIEELHILPDGERVELIVSQV